MKYLGLVENVRVRRAGFCFRETYEAFFWRYRMLSPSCFPTYDGSERDGCKRIMDDLVGRSLPVTTTHGQMALYAAPFHSLKA